VIQQTGQMLTIDGLNKVVQEIVHIFAHDEGTFSDYGYPDYGSKLLRFVGSKNANELRLRFQVLRDLQYWNQIKESQHRRFGNIDAKELIRQIVSIKFVNDIDTQSIELSAFVGDETELQFFTIRRFNF